MIAKTACPLPEPYARLQEKYRAKWSIWLSPQGHPWAVRLQPGLSDDQINCGMEMTISPKQLTCSTKTVPYQLAPGTPEQLEELLDAQDKAEDRYQMRIPA